LAILIASLGLYGMSTFFAVQHRKEIGIRKVLGESVTGILFLLLKDFIKWVIVANIAAWPIGWWVARKWLQNFVYRDNISPWAFFLAGIITLFIATFSS